MITKYNKPILTAADIPYSSDLVFNAGVAKYQGKYVMMFRNDYGYKGGGAFEGTNIGFAQSDDGINWSVAAKPCFWLSDDEIRRAYDPRITVIEGRCYICFAVDTKHGLRGGIAVTEDFEKFDILSMSLPDNRNMVLFPEKIGGKYVRLERPFSSYGRIKPTFDMWISDSPDLKYWGNSDLLLDVQSVPFANNKIGPAAPPVKTDKGWLTLFHSVDFDSSRGKNGWETLWQKRYMAGVMLLNLDNPHKIEGLCLEPVIKSDRDFEFGGFRDDVIFPGGMILEDNGEVKIYYGAADAFECLATTSVDYLLSLVTK